MLFFSLFKEKKTQPKKKYNILQLLLREFWRSLKLTLPEHCRGITAYCTVSPERVK